MPTLYKRSKKPKWLGVVTVNGVRRQQLFEDDSLKSKREAMAWEKDTREAMVAGQTRTASSKVSIKEWASAYLDDAKRRNQPKTYKEKRKTFKELIKTMGHTKDVSKITIPDAAKHLGKQNDNRSGNAANKDRKNLAAAWDFGVKYINGFPELRNPFRAVDKFGYDEQERYIPPWQDIKKVLDLCEGQDSVIMAALLKTAARRGELWRLKWRHVDFERGLIRLKTRKRKGGGMEEDDIPMVDDLRGKLAWWKRVQPVETEFVFVNLDERSQTYGQPFKERQRFFRTKCKKAGVKRFGYHALRHYAATVMVRSNCPLDEVQLTLRHKNPLTTARYIKSLGPEEAREGLERSLGAIQV